MCARANSQAVVWQSCVKGMSEAPTALSRQTRLPSYTVGSDQHVPPLSLLSPASLRLFYLRAALDIVIFTTLVAFSSC